MVLPLVNHRNYVEMSKAIGAEVLLKDPRFETLEGVMTSKDEIFAVLANWAKPRNVENIVGHMQAAGLPCARYRSAAETLDDEHLVARGSFVKALDGMGTFTVVNAPFQTSAMSIGAQSHVSATGENTQEVLASISMGEQEIADLISTNVIV